MKTIIKKTAGMAEILGITERAVTYRVKSIRRKAYVLNKKALAGEISMGDAAKRIIEMNDKKLAGYSYQVDGTQERPQYTFCKNV